MYKEYTVIGINQRQETKNFTIKAMSKAHAYYKVHRLGYTIISIS